MAEKMVNIPWYVDEKEKVKVRSVDFYNFLDFLGIKRLKEENSYEFAVVRENIIRRIPKSDIVRMLLDWLSENFEMFKQEDVEVDDVLDAFINKSKLLLDDKALYFIKTIEYRKQMDSPHDSYIYFLNTAVHISKESISLVNYEDLQWQIMEQQILPRTFHMSKNLNSNKSIPFQQFVSNLAKNDPERILPLETTLGYMLHRHKNFALTKAVVFMDENMNEIDLVEGGTGKSLLMKGVGHMRNVCEISGKGFKGSMFDFQRVNAETDIVLINDANPNLSLDTFYNITADGFAINRKYKSEILLSYEESPKIAFTTNYVLKAPAGNSTDRRRIEFEVAQHYGKNLTVYNDFKHFFFTDWNQKQWDEFSYYMMHCLQSYLNNGLMEAPSINLTERRLISELGVEFLEFMEEELSSKKKLHKKELFSKFSKGGYVNQRYLPNQRTFTTKVKKYLEYKQISYKETPLNTKMYFEILTEKDLKPLITIDNIDTNYKTVDTANKMTRLSKQLQKLFNNENVTK